MKNILEQAMNKVNVVGKLLDANVADGTLSDGRKYLRANLTVRVTQTYGGKEETSEIPVSMFAGQFTNSNKPNPGYKQIHSLMEMKTAQNVGYDNADTGFFDRNHRPGPIGFRDRTYGISDIRESQGAVF